MYFESIADGSDNPRSRVESCQVPARQHIMELGDGAKIESKNKNLSIDVLSRDNQ